MTVRDAAWFARALRDGCRALDTALDTNTIAPPITDRIDAAQQTLSASAKLFLPVENCKVETAGDVVFLRLDSLNSGSNLTLLIDRKFWDTLRHSDALLHLEGRRVMLRHTSPYASTRADHQLARVVTGRFEDYFSVRLIREEPGLADYRRANLEVRHISEQIAEADVRAGAEIVAFERPEYPMVIGDHTVALGGTAQETTENVQANPQPVVGLSKHGEGPRTLVWGKLRKDHDHRQSNNLGTYDPLESLTKAYEEGDPLPLRDSEFAPAHIV